MNRKLGRKKAYREHTLRNLVTSLVLFEQMETTEAKAKEVKRLVDRLISRNKAGDLNARRALHGYLFDKNAVAKVIEELIPRYQTRPSGFTKSYHLKNRAGDNAPMMRLELVDHKVFVGDQKKAAKEETSTKAEKKGDTAVTVRTRKPAKSTAVESKTEATNNE